MQVEVKVTIEDRRRMREFTVSSKALVFIIVEMLICTTLLANNSVALLKCELHSIYYMKHATLSWNIKPCCSFLLHILCISGDC